MLLKSHESTEVAVELGYMRPRGLTRPPEVTLTKYKTEVPKCSKLKSPETRQVQERYIYILEHLQVQKLDRTRCPEEKSSTKMYTPF